MWYPVPPIQMSIICIGLLFVNSLLLGVRGCVLFWGVLESAAVLVSLVEED